MVNHVTYASICRVLNFTSTNTVGHIRRLLVMKDTLPIQPIGGEVVIHVRIIRNYI